MSRNSMKQIICIEYETALLNKKEVMNLYNDFDILIFSTCINVQDMKTILHKKNIPYYRLYRICTQYPELPEGKYIIL